MLLPAPTDSLFLERYRSDASVREQSTHRLDGYTVRDCRTQVIVATPTSHFFPNDILYRTGRNIDLL